MTIFISLEAWIKPIFVHLFLCNEEERGYYSWNAKGDIEAPRRAVWNKEPCDKCKEYMSGALCLSVNSFNLDESSPYRSGAMCVLKEGALSGFYWRHVAKRAKTQGSVRFG
jgi:hypothetical protein